MASRFKEDEKNERIIRGLLKLPDNRRCINCNSLGPQYVCINFSTFICTNCSGVHREFTHRVKSVSMAKFTSQEVSALQGGGNASAKEIYLKEWDPQHNSLPDGSNVERLRDFIKHVYVDRKYTGERGLPRGKGESVDLNENKRVDTYQGSSQSSGGRSPGYDLENRQHSDHKKNSSVEVINDWRREDRFGNGRRLEESRSFDGGSKVEIKSPDRRSDLDSPSPPVVRPVRDILGDSASPLRVIEPPKTIGGRPTDAHVQTQRAASSTSLASTNGIQAEASLIDFGDVLEPAQTTAVQQTHQLAKATPAPPPTSSGADNWANFESVPVKAATKANQLDVLSELMTPASSAPVGIFPPSSSTPIPAAVSPLRGFGLSAFPAGASAAASGQWPTAQPQHPALLVTGSQSLPHHSIPVVSGHPSSQRWNPIAPSGHALDFTSGIAPTVDNKSVGRKELPADLFAATYPSMYPAVQGWYAAPPHGHGFPMQYNMQVTPTVMQPTKSSNPFDTTNEPPPLQASTFPSVGSLQGALPNMGHPQPPSYVSALPPSNFLYNPAGYGLGGAAYPAMNTNQQLGGGLHAAPAQNSFPPPAGNPFG